MPSEYRLRNSTSHHGGDIFMKQQQRLSVGSGKGTAMGEIQRKTKINPTKWP